MDIGEIKRIVRVEPEPFLLPKDVPVEPPAPVLVPVER